MDKEGEAPGSSKAGEAAAKMTSNRNDPGHELNVRAQGWALSPLLPLLRRQENIQSHRKAGREKEQKYKTARKQLTRGQE